MIKMADLQDGKYQSRKKQKAAMKFRSKCSRANRGKGKECKAEFTANRQIELEEIERKKEDIQVQMEAARLTGIPWVDPEAEKKMKAIARKAAEQKIKEQLERQDKLREQQKKQ